MIESKIKKVISDAEDQYPYKQSGNRDSYSQYNEGWSDACGVIESQLEDEGVFVSVNVLEERLCAIKAECDILKKRTESMVSKIKTLEARLAAKNDKKS